jgi:hypothetical protein
MAQQDATGLGQRHRARPAGALEQALADRALERRNLLGNRGLRVSKARCRTPE